MITTGNIMKTIKKTNKHIIHIALDRPASLPSLKYLLSGNFGGYTLTEGVGGWREGAKVIQETSYIITLYGNSDKKVELFCERIKRLYKQTEIIYTSEQITYNSIS
jgi:DMSO/TMAO reductase YedYZ molybdopterin-dependent catalytic subunit